MKEYLNNFLLFVQFFTRIPINRNLNCGMDNFRKGSIFFPVIGLIIGIVQWFIYYCMIKVLPPNVVAVLVLLFTVIITGALHVDGLGDMCDGFFAFKGGKDKIIEIMKDSRIGAYACIAIFFDLLLRYTLISSSIAYSLTLKKFSFILIVAPIIGRFTVVFLAFIGKNAKKEGSGNIFIGNIDIKRVVIAGLIAILSVYAFIGVKDTIILIVSAMCFSFLFNKFCESKIEGLTGDLLGANNELVEILIMMIFLAVNLK